MKFIKKNTKPLIMFIVLICIVLVFFNQIGVLLISIGNSIDYKSNTFITGYFIFSILLIAIYVVLISKRYIHNKWLTFLISFITVSFILYRFFFNQDICFYKVFSPIAFADIIIVITILHYLNILLVWKKEARINKQKNVVKDYFFIEDNVFNDGEIDNEIHLKKLLKEVKGFKPKEAFSIGLNAFWGYGKTSFLHRFKKKYEEENPDEIIFWYRIWKNKGSDSVIENFFEELKKHLTAFSGEISSTIDKYVSSILSLSGSDLEKIADISKSILFDDKTLEGFYENINNEIKRIDKQIIILLDDLDRLETEEILNTLKLIRTLSDFNNVIFISGYDREYVIEKINETRNNYLDKVFNVEINLLPFNSRLIDDELLRIVDKTFPNTEEQRDVNIFNYTFKNLFQQLKEQLSIENDTAQGEITLDSVVSSSSNEGEEINTNNCEEIYNFNYQSFLPTYRDVKRFINEFKFYASFIEDKNVEGKADVIISEYILLRLLTYKYRDVNTKILYKINDFLSREYIDFANERTIVLSDVNLHNVYIYNKSFYELKKKFSNYNNEDVKIIHGVLCRLFGKKPVGYYKKNYNTISKIYYTSTYIQNNVLNSIISISDLQESLNENRLHSFVKELAEKISLDGRYHLVSEIKYFIFDVFMTIDSKKKFRDILKTLQTILERIDFKDAQKIIQFINKGFNELYEGNKTNIKEDVIEVIKQSNFKGGLDYLFSDINLNKKRKGSGLYNNLVTYEDLPFEKDLKEIYLNKLSLLIETKEECNIVYSVYVLYIEAIIFDKKVLFSPEANNLIRDDIENRFSDYFNSSLFDSLRVIKTNDELDVFNGFEPLFSIAQIFSSSETLEQLKENPENKDLFNKFYKEGWENLFTFLESFDITNSDLRDEGEEVFNRAKKLVKLYLINKCKPLSKRQYKEVINED